MNEEANEPMSEEEQFSTLYYYFVMHVRGLASDAGKQLSSGYFDVPWEVKDDLVRVAGLLHLPSARAIGSSIPLCECRQLAVLCPSADDGLVPTPFCRWWVTAMERRKTGIFFRWVIWLTDTRGPVCLQLH